MVLIIPKEKYINLPWDYIKGKTCRESRKLHTPYVFRGYRSLTLVENGLI